MTASEREILATLQELKESVERMKTSPVKPNLLPLFEKVDRLTLSLPPNSDRSLLHYLHKKSYDKALQHLRERAAETPKNDEL